MPMRKIVHIDMDAFYASVEQRDDSQPRGKPGIVAWRGNLSVQEQRFRLVGAVVSNFLHPEDISAQPAIFG